MVPIFGNGGNDRVVLNFHRQNHFKWKHTHTQTVSAMVSSTDDAVAAAAGASSTASSFLTSTVEVSWSSQWDRKWNLLSRASPVFGSGGAVTGPVQSSIVKNELKNILPSWYYYFILPSWFCFMLLVLRIPMWPGMVLPICFPYHLLRHSWSSSQCWQFRNGRCADICILLRVLSESESEGSMSWPDSLALKNCHYRLEKRVEIQIV